MTDLIYGEFRKPRQMLQEQKYDDHVSLHDDEMADKLGFVAGPIEGPTHFSQFVPLLHDMFGDAWFEKGCVSAHYKNMVVEGESVRPFVGPLEPGATITRIGAEKEDGTPVLTGTASVGPDYGETEIEQRLGRLRPPDQLVICSELHVGQKGAGNPEDAIMEPDQHLGDLYPFTLNEKLRVITENHPYYTADGSPWRKAVIPLEMISCLAQYTGRTSGFALRSPNVGLFAAQEIRLIKGPLFVSHPYKIEREIIALSESRRTESNWVRSSLFDGETGELAAEIILNNAHLKDSYPDYETDAKALGKAL